MQKKGFLKEFRKKLDMSTLEMAAYVGLKTEVSWRNYEADKSTLPIWCAYKLIDLAAERKIEGMESMTLNDIYPRDEAVRKK